MAVKIINVERQKEKEVKETLKREVELLAKLSHVSLLNYLLYLWHLLIIRYSRISLITNIHRAGNLESQSKYSCLRLMDHYVPFWTTGGVSI